jgi:hypothetical protein
VINRPADAIARRARISRSMAGSRAISRALSPIVHKGVLQCRYTHTPGFINIVLLIRLSQSVRVPPPGSLCITSLSTRCAWAPWRPTAFRRPYRIGEGEPNTAEVTLARPK